MEMQNIQANLQLQCTEHWGTPCQFIYLKEGIQKNFICSECLYFSEQKGTPLDITDLIPISIALRSPERFLSQINKKNKNSIFNMIEQFLDSHYEQEFENSITNYKKFEQTLKEIILQIDQKRKDYEKFKLQLKNLRDEFLNVHYYFNQKIEYHTIYDIFKELCQQGGENKKSDLYTQIEMKFSSLIDKLLEKDCQKITQELDMAFCRNIEFRNRVKNLSNTNLSKYHLQINNIHLEYQRFINRVFGTLMPSIILTGAFEKTVLSRIETQQKKKIIDKQLIFFFGNRNDLDLREFWESVKGKKNLLMIFRNKTHIFGGYSPWQWEIVAHPVLDSTGSSFIFSQTLNQIFALKQAMKHQPIDYNKDYGPCFGSDLVISRDFQNGYSKLGEFYEYQRNEQYQTILFGGLQPNIIECEVFKLSLA